jgi:predicted transcriptional regulator
VNETITLERRFAIIDEWVLDLNISDRAVRLYAVLARYADSETHKAYPSRGTLAERLRCSKASVDRAAQELVDAGAMTEEATAQQLDCLHFASVVTTDEGGRHW